MNVWLAFCKPAFLSAACCDAVVVRCRCCCQLSLLLSDAAAVSVVDTTVAFAGQLLLGSTQSSSAHNGKLHSDLLLSLLVFIVGAAVPVVLCRSW